MNKTYKTVVIGRLPDRFLNVIETSSRLDAHYYQNSQSVMADSSENEIAICIVYFASRQDVDIEQISHVCQLLKSGVILICPEFDEAMLRRAMQCGVRDCLTHDCDPQDLMDSVDTILRHHHAESGAKCKTNAVICASSPIHSAYVATNLAHMCAQHSKQPTLLIDMELQFNIAHRFLDVNVDRSFISALASVESLDQSAITGYTIKHASGLGLLSTIADEIVLPGELEAVKIQQFIMLLQQLYAHIYIFVPSVIDPVNIELIKNSDQILLVIEQSVPSLAIATNMVNLLTQEIQVERKKIAIVVNAHHKFKLVKLEEIINTFQGIAVHVIKHDKDNYAQSRDTGVPIFESAKNSALSKSLMAVANELSGYAFLEPRGFLQGAVSSLNKMFNRRKTRC